MAIDIRELANRAAQGQSSAGGVEPLAFALVILQSVAINAIPGINHDSEEPAHAAAVAAATTTLRLREAAAGIILEALSPSAKPASEAPVAPI